MFHTIADFLHTWQEEAENTEKLLKALSNDSLNKKLGQNIRTLKQLAWHIIETPQEMLHLTGIKIAAPDSSIKAAPTVEGLVKEHRKSVDSVTHEIQTHWNNKTLHQTDNMYGEEWTRSQTLAALLSHLIHHRGQMTILMRLAGLKVPGIYGPAQEEWVAYGMQAPVED